MNNPEEKSREQKSDSMDGDFRRAGHPILRRQMLMAGALFALIIVLYASSDAVWSHFFDDNHAGHDHIRHPETVDSGPGADSEDGSEVFMVVEQMPQLVGGLEGLISEIEYPEIARKAGIEGRVFVQFVVDTEGRARDIVVVRGIGGGCDEEAVRAIAQTKWIPGQQRGRDVAVKMSIPVKFELAEEDTTH